MELNVTAGIFIVLMVAIAAVVLLCCCKAYVLCKRSQLRRSSSSQDRRISRRSRIHHHLPEGSSYNDEPPNYDDILTGKIPSSIATPIGSEIFIANSELKSSGDRIMVKWSYDTEDAESIAPPQYSCVIIEENDDNAPPPSYYENKDSIKSSQTSSSNTVNDSSLSERMSQRVYNVISTVSEFLIGPRRSDNQTTANGDVSCNSDVMATPTSSNVTSTTIEQ